MVHQKTGCIEPLGASCWLARGRLSLTSDNRAEPRRNSQGGHHDCINETAAIYCRPRACISRCPGVNATPHTEHMHTEGDYAY